MFHRPSLRSFTAYLQPGETTPTEVVVGIVRESAPLVVPNRAPVIHRARVDSLQGAHTQIDQSYS
jgi:hypothetical protein